jgi:hypothetical protein
MSIVVTTSRAAPAVARPAPALRARPAAAARAAPSFSALGRPAAPAPRPSLRCRAAEPAAAPAAAPAGVAEAVAVLRAAAADGSVPGPAIFTALTALERAKLPADGWAATLGGAAPAGRRWRLVATVKAKAVAAAARGAPGTASYFPLTAVQQWEDVGAAAAGGGTATGAGTITNGIFLSWVASLKFSGPYALKGKRLAFDFDTLTLQLGPLSRAFSIKPKMDPAAWQAGGKDPFFLWFYADESLVAARGRGGGLAFWARATPRWEAENGVA